MTGAGLLEYDAQVLIRRAGYAPVSGKIMLPKNGQRLLIYMVTGKDVYKPPRDIVDETIRAGKAFDQ